MSMRIDDTFAFGKYKGFKVREILKDDPGYLCWLREAKKKDAASGHTVYPSEKAFDNNTNAMIDDAILASKSLKIKYKAWSYDEAEVAPTVSIAKEKYVANAISAYSEQWGSY
jgi:hypothetical protein